MRLDGSLGRLVDLFWSRTETPRCNLYSNIDRSHATALVLTRCFYVGLLTIAFRHLMLWDYYVGLRHIQPLWPVAWATLAPDSAAAGVLLLFLGGSLLAAVFPTRLAARALACAGCLEFFAFLDSFGTIRHDNHLLILTAFLFTCLPRGPANTVEEKRAFLRAFWGVQCGALLTYSMSGIVKIVMGLWQLATQRAGVLTPSAFSLHVANSGFRFGVEPLFGDLAIRAGVLGLPLYLAVIYLETFSLAIAFRAGLHRAWGAALIAMHLAIGLTINLFFLPSVLVVGILFLASPFSPEPADWRRSLRDLPLLGRFLARRPTS